MAAVTDKQGRSAHSPRLQPFLIIDLAAERIGDVASAGIDGGDGTTSRRVRRLPEGLF